MARAVIILAAGKGTRMNSDLPKVLHPLANFPLLGHVLEVAMALEPSRIVVVAGHGAADVQGFIALACPMAEVVHQTAQLGTAHAVTQALPALAGLHGEAVVLYGDVPRIRAETLNNLFAQRREGEIAVLGFEAADPGRYGRLKTSGDRLESIVEFKDASAEERLITLCNSGVIALDIEALSRLVPMIGSENASGEYYLTDIIALHKAGGGTSRVVKVAEEETAGINTTLELAVAERLWQADKQAELLGLGVRITSPDTVRFSHDTLIGPETVIEPYVVFGPGVTVENGAQIRAFSHLEGCHVSEGAVIGPYARLRPGAEIGEGARIGNFVEVKSAEVARGAKVNHLTYIGDASIGEGANIGAGSVTCNYDGVSKHRTEIGAGAFIGSGTLMVAPLRIGAEAVTGSGSVITEDVPDGALALGRARQETKPGRGRRLMELFRSRKAKATKDQN